ncbi:MAG: tRNA pseudouridine(38-40) synthase TruA [Deltaproteobacteria bacterium]|jgi:tRNA pseudouridine38-40 synthase|nr:tRNA pseudouridine(38-40) synthase TruA [Deltaproteobacteria bacterium]
MVKNFKLVVAYEGTNYLGWQRQGQGQTIQALLEEALGQVCDHPVTLHGSGRTDAGVHAQGQVASFLTSSLRNPRQIVAGANSLLPEEIAVLSAEEVDLGFHARFSAQGKLYSYDFGISPVRDPLTSRFSWPVGHKLDWRKAEMCFPVLLGEKDFASFQSQGGEVKTTIRTVPKIELTTLASNIVRISIYGTGFLRHMVRTMAGAFYQAARGKLSPDELNLILEAKNRRQAGRVAPARGLCLRRVFYEDWPFETRKSLSED